MKLLLDTHAYMWFADGNTLLSEKARLLIENQDNSKYVSMVSFYEMAIKIKTGKLSLTISLKDYFEYAKKNGITVLPLSENYIFEYNTVPLLADHRDPFDRLIIATAIYEKLEIITTDAMFKNYNNLVNIAW